jgi:hypothetical protein
MWSSWDNNYSRGNGKTLDVKLETLDVPQGTIDVGSWALDLLCMLDVDNGAPDMGHGHRHGHWHGH